MNEREALVYIRRLIRTAGGTEDIEAVREHLHMMLLIANKALLPEQRKPGMK